MTWKAVLDDPRVPEADKAKIKERLRTRIASGLAPAPRTHPLGAADFETGDPIVVLKDGQWVVEDPPVEPTPPLSVPAPRPTPRPPQAATSAVPRVTPAPKPTTPPPPRVKAPPVKPKAPPPPTKMFETPGMRPGVSIGRPKPPGGNQSISAPRPQETTPRQSPQSVTQEAIAEAANVLGAPTQQVVEAILQVPAAAKAFEAMSADVANGYSWEQALARHPFVLIPLGGPPGSLGAGPSWFARRAAAKAEQATLREGISVGERPNAMDAIREEARKFRADWVDATDPIRKAEAAMRPLGSSWPNEIHEVARATRGTAGKVGRILRSGPVDYNTLEFTGAPGLEALKTKIMGAGGRTGAWQMRSLDEFRRYAVDRRALELHARGIESGVDITNARANVTRLGPKYSEAFDELQAFQNANLRYARDAGTLSDDAYNAILQDNLAYVPFQRVQDFEAQFAGGGKRFANLQSGIRKIAGSELKIIDPLESAVKHTHDIIAAADKNAVGKALAELARNAPGNPFMKAATMIGPGRPKDPNAISVLIHGKRKYFEVDPDLNQALTNLDHKELPKLAQLLRYPAGWLRAGATLTPEFMAGNPIRDTFAAFIQSKYGFVPAWDTMKGAFHVLGRSDLYKKWQLAGGDNSFLTTIDRGDVQKQLKAIMGTPAEKAMNILNPIEALRMLSELSEKATRVGAFARATGGNPLMERVGLAAAGEGLDKAGMIKGAVASRDSTVDFGRMGSSARAWNAVSAFLNARIQGWDRMAQTLSNPKTAPTAWAKGAAGITLPSMILTANNMQDPRWKSVPQWEKIAFWHIMVPQNDAFGPLSGKIMRIPKPPGYATVFATPFEAAVEFIGNQDPKALDRITQSLKQEAPNLLPTGVQVPLEAWADKSFFRNAPIIPPSRKDYAPPYQVGDQTPETAKMLGEATNQSPAIIEHVVRGLGGGLASHALSLADQMTQRGRDAASSRPEGGIETWPGAKAFFSSYDRGSDQTVTDFYKARKESGVAYDTYRMLSREQPGKAAGYYDANKAAIDGYFSLNNPKLTEILKVFDDQRRAIEGGSDTPQEKAAAIDALQRQKAQLIQSITQAVGATP